MLQFLEMDVNHTSIKHTVHFFFNITFILKCIRVYLLYNGHTVKFNYFHFMICLLKSYILFLRDVRISDIVDLLDTHYVTANYI